MAITQVELTALYLSYFGRPPDQGGMEFYLAQPDATVQSVAAAFSASPESMDLIGPVFGADQVDRIYMNLFGRHAEPDGLTYWSKQVADGLMTPAFAAYGIFLGAQNADLISVQNKMDVATVFLAHLDTQAELDGYSGNAAAAAARAFMDTVGPSASSRVSALANVDAAIAAMLASGESGGPTYTFDAPVTMEEGQTIYITVHTTGVAPGVQLQWTVTGVQPEDMEGTLTGTVTVGADGRAVILLMPLIDALADSPETLTLTVGTGHVNITLNESSGPAFDSYLVNATLKGNNHVFRNGTDTGSADYTSKSFADQLTVGGTTDVGALAGFKVVTMSDAAVLTMTGTTYGALVNAASLTTKGTQSVILTDALSGKTLNAGIENFTLAGVTGNDVTLGAGTQNVTGGAEDDVLRTGAATTVTGTLDLGAQTKADALYISTTGTNISGATTTSIEVINLDTDVNATMTLAQAATLNVGAGGNKVTVTDSGTLSGVSQVEAYVLADDTGNDFTLGDSKQNVTGAANEDDVIRTGGLTLYEGTVEAGGETGADKFIVSPTGADISGAALNGIEEIDLDTDANVTMTAAQHALLNTSDGTNTVTLANADTLTGKADVEAYVLADATGNDFTLGADQDVTGAANQDDTIRTGAVTSVTGTLDAGGQTGTDLLVVSTTGTDISGATTTGFEQIDLDSGVSATMTLAQHSLLKNATGTNTVTLTDNGTATANADVESYQLASTGANDFTLTAAGQNVTGGSDDDTVRTGTLTSLTGTLDGGSETTADTLVVNTSADISAAAVSNFEALELDTDVSVTMTVAENAILTTAAGTNKVTLSDSGTATGGAEVEEYQLGSTGANDFTLGSGSQTVTGSDTEDDTIRTGAATSITATLAAGGETSKDQLVVTTTGTDISAAVLSGFEEINLDNDVDATMTLAEHALLGTSAGTNTVTLTDAGTLTGKSDVESYVLSGAGANNLTLGAADQNVTGQSGVNDTINTGSLTSITGDISLGTGDTDVVNINTTGTDISGSVMSNVDVINLDTDVDATMTDTQNSALLAGTAAGTNTVTLTTAATSQGAATVEKYVLADVAGNDFTIGATGQSVIGGTEDDTVHTGAVTSFTGTTVDGGAHTTGDTLVITTTGTDITTGTVTNFEIINLGSGVSATMTIAQHNLLGTAAGTNTVTLTDAGTFTANAQVESFVLSGSGPNDITLTANPQNVTGQAAANDIVRTGTQTTVTGAIDLGLGGTDQLVISTTATDISAATTTNLEQINLDTGVSAKMTIAQNALVNAAAGTNTITLADAGTASGNANVENYQLANGTNTFTTGTTSQNVTGGTGADTVKAAGTLTATYDLAGGTDILELTGNSDITAATLTAVEQINLDNNVNATMTIAYNALVNLAAGTNTITLSDAGTTKGNANVENYILKDAAGNDFTLGASQNVTGSNTQDDIVRTGTVTNVGNATIALGGGAADQLIITTTGTKIDNVTLTGVEQINLDSGVSATMTIAENALVNTAAGTNTITLADGGSATGNANVESYVLANKTGNIFTLGRADQNVSGTANKDDTVHTGAFTALGTSTIDLGNGNDLLVIDTTGTDISKVSFNGNLETISLGAGINASMTVAQHGASAVTGGGSNTVTLTTGGTVTGSTTIASYVLADAAGNDLTLGTAGQNVTGSGTRDDIVRAGTLASVTGTIDLGAGTADQLVLSSAGGTDIHTATLSNIEQINFAANAKATMTIAQHAAVTTLGGTNTITFSDGGAVTGKSGVANYVLANASGNVFTLGTGTTAQSIKASGTQDDTVNTGAVTTVTATIDFGAGTDTLVITTDATNISGATLTNLENITLGNNSASMKIAQANLITSATGGANTVTLTDGGAVTGLAAVETYSLANASGNVFTMGTGTTSQVVKGTGTQNDTVNTGALTTLGSGINIDLGAGTDTLVLGANIDISAANLNLANLENITLGTFSATMTVAQNAKVTSAAGGANTITLSDGGATTGLAAVEAYVLADAAGNVFTMGTGTTTQSITATGTQNDKVNTGALTTLGAGITIDLGAGTDTLVFGATANISAANLTLANLENIDLATFSGTMTVAQAAKITAAAGGANAVILTNGGTLTGYSGVESYTLANASGNVFTLGTGTTTQTVTATGTQNDTVNTGALATLGAGIVIDLGAGTDTLVVGADVNMSAANLTLANLENIDLGNFNATMTAAQAAKITAAAGGANAVILTTGGALTGYSGVESYTLANASGNVFTLGAGTTTQTIAATGTQNDTVNTGALTTLGAGINIDLGAGTDTLVLGANIDISAANLNLANLENITLGTFNATMTVAQNAKVTSAAGGANTITLSDGGATTGFSAVETYSLANAAGNVFTMGTGTTTQAIKGTGTQDDTVNTGALTTLGAGINIDLGAGTDTLVIGANINTSAANLNVANLENIDLATFNATMTIAQAAKITAASGGANTVTFTDAGAATGSAFVENYLLANLTGNVFTLGAKNQNVTGATGFADTVNTGSVTDLGTANLVMGGTGTDVLVVHTTGTDISGATTSSIEQIKLDSGVTAKMTLTQHGTLNTFDTTNNVIFSAAVTTTGKAGMGGYTLANASGNVFTVGSTSQNVTGDAADDTVKAAGTLTGTYDLLGGTDTLELTATSDITGATIKNVENINIDTGATVTMTIAQHAMVNTGASSTTIKFTDAGTVTGKSTVTNYVLSSTAANTFTMGAGQGVAVNGTGAWDDVVNSGSVTTFGAITIDLGNGTNDKLVVQNDADISGATITNVELLELASGADVKMKIAQHAALTSFDGTNTIAFSDTGTVTGKATIAAYTLADGTTNFFTVGSTTQNVTGGTANDTVLASGTLGSVTYSLGGGSDTLELTANSDISAATLTSVEFIALDNNVNVSMTAAQAPAVAGAAGTNTITLTTAGTAVGSSQVEFYVLSDSGSNDFTLGKSDQVVTASDSFDDIIRTGSLTSFTGTVNFGSTGADQLVVTSAGTNISGATLNGVEQINLATGASATITLTQHGLLNVFDSSNSVTFDAAVTATGKAGMGGYTLASAAGNVFTVGSTSQNVTGGSSDDTVKSAGTLTLGVAYALGGGNDTLELTGNSDISQAATTLEFINLDSTVTATMTATQHGLLNTFDATNSVIFSGTAVVTGKSGIGSYTLGNSSGNVFTLGTGTTTQTIAALGTQNDTVNTGALSTLGAGISIDLGAGTDTLVLTANIDISAANLNLSNLEGITLGTSNATMTVAQNLKVTSAAGGANTITLSDGGATTGFSAVETYLLANASGNVFTIGTGTTTQTITGTGTQDDTVNTGAVTTLGATFNIDLGAGTDTLVLGGNTNMTAANLNLANLENIDLGNFTATMTAAQADKITAAAGGANSVTLTTAGTFTGYSGVESYALANASGNIMTLGTGTTAQIITASGTQNDIVNTGAVTTLGSGFNINLGAGTDTLVITTDGTNISAANLNLANLENITLGTNSATMTVLQAAKITSAAGGANAVTFTDVATAVTGLATIEKYVLANGVSNTFTTAGGLLSQSVTTGNGTNVVTTTGTITGTFDFTAGSTDTLKLSGAANLNGATLSGIETIDMNTKAITMTASQHNGVTTFSNTAGGITISDATVTTVIAGASAAYTLSNAGNDSISFSGLDAVRAVQTVALSGGGTDTVTVDDSDGLNNNNGNEQVTVSGFVAGAGAGFDILSTKLSGGTAFGNFQNNLAATGNANVTAQASGTAFEISSNGNTALTSMTGGSPKVLDAISAAIGAINAGTYMMVVYSNNTTTPGTGADAGVYIVNVATNQADLTNGNYTIEHVVTLTGVGANTLVAGNIV